MWILAILAWKRPRLAAKIVAWWSGIMAVCAIVAAPCRIYLRTQGAPVPWDAAPVYDVAGFFAALLVLAAIAVVLLERSDRRKATS